MTKERLAEIREICINNSPGYVCSLSEFKYEEILWIINSASFANEQLKNVMISQLISEI